MLISLPVSGAVMVTVCRFLIVIPEEAEVGLAVAGFQVALSGEDSQVEVLFQFPEATVLK